MDGQLEAVAQREGLDPALLGEHVPQRDQAAAAGTDAQLVIGADGEVAGFRCEIVQDGPVAVPLLLLPLLGVFDANAQIEGGRVGAGTGAGRGARQGHIGRCPCDTGHGLYERSRG